MVGGKKKGVEFDSLRPEKVKPVLVLVEIERRVLRFLGNQVKKVIDGEEERLKNEAELKKNGLLD